MNVMVTGAQGFIGQAVCDVLEHKGVRYIPVNHAEIDLLNYNQISSFMQTHRPTHLLHLAWCTTPGKYWEDAENARWVAASHMLIEYFIMQGGQRFVGAGSCIEYDWSAPCPFDEDKTPRSDASLYARSKNSLLDFLRSTKNLSWAWGRIFFPYGPGENPVRLFPSLVKALRGDIPPFGVNANHRRDYLHVDDVGRALATLCLEPDVGIFNIASGTGTRIGDVVSTLAARLGKDPETILSLPSARQDPYPNVIGLNDKLCALGWRPQIALKDGLDDLLALKTEAV